MFDGWIELYYFKSTAKKQVKIKIQTNWQPGFIKDNSDYTSLIHIISMIIVYGSLGICGNTIIIKLFSSFIGLYFQSSVVMLNKDVQQFSLQ